MTLVLPLFGILKSNYYNIILISILFLANNTRAGNVIDDPDYIFLKARQFVAENNFEQAMPILERILYTFPDYHDASIMKARIHAWQNQFSTADSILKAVLKKSPGNTDALSAIIDVAMWSGNFNAALYYIDIALASQPENAELLIRKASALYETGDPGSALGLLEQLLSDHPANLQARRLQNKIIDSMLKTRFGAYYRGHYFFEADDAAPWHLYYLELEHRINNFGSITARLNLAQRHNFSGTQIELDAYPIIRPGTYLYLNVGYSGFEDLFPSTRFGLEVFQALSPTLEGSAGARLLNFQPNSLFILTGSLSKTFSNYYFSFRPFFPVPLHYDTPTGQSYFLTIRRHFLSHHHYLSLIAGRGFSVDIDRFIGAEIYDLGGTLADVLVQYQHPFKQFLIRIGVGYKFYEDDQGTAPLGNPLVITGGLAYRLGKRF